MLNIKKLREICEKATPGSWKAVASRTAVGVCYRIFPESWGKVPDHGGICAYDDYTSLNPHPKGEQAANAQFIAAARTALPELLDEVERLREEVRLLHENINAIKQSIVDTVGGTDYEGNPTNHANYLQRLRILVKKEKALKLACSIIEERVFT